MWTCERCGAALAPDSEQCGYCGTVSEPARRALQAQRALERQQASQAALQATAQAAILRQTAFSATEQAASKTLLWGLLSIVFVCLPIPSVLSWVSFDRAKRVARDGGLSVPGRAKIGLACAALSLLASAAFWVWVAEAVHEDNVHLEARQAELARQIAARANSPQLDQAFACALAEQYILTNGFAGSTSAGSFRGLSCAGALRVSKDRAELPDFRLRVSSSAPQVSATLCFKYVARWFVDSAGAVGCDSSAPSSSAPRAP